MAAPLATLIDQYLRAQGIPLVSVSIRDDANRLTWTIQFPPDITDVQKALALSLLSTFDPAAPAVVNAGVDRDAAAAINTQAIKAVLAMLLDVRLGRRLTPADGPVLRAVFDQTITYYKFIVQNGL